ncbi:MAG TPA: hypothetical protein VMZ90_09340 [Vicinamibacterales bacterium]|nr:hypothetical protein [Vicinamibacterales bacterium]
MTSTGPLVHWTARIFMCAAAAQAAIFAQAPTPQPDTSARAVIAKAVSYLKDYKDTVQFVLADEVTLQDVFNRLGRRAAHRETSGEFFLTYLPAEGGWVGVRDIALVDGVPVEKRDNLRELLTKASFARIGRQLVDRNARYNIGSVSRNMNDPMLALVILDDKHRDRFKFDRRRVEPTPAGPLVTVTFTERDEPTLVRGADGTRIFAKGELMIDAATGRLVRTVIVLKDKATTGTLTTAFTEHEKLGLWLPASMDERYDHEIGNQKELVVAKSIYSNYRRFNVNVVIK